MTWKYRLVVFWMIHSLRQEITDKMSTAHFSRGIQVWQIRTKATSVLRSRCTCYYLFVCFLLLEQRLCYTTVWRKASRSDWNYLMKQPVTMLTYSRLTWTRHTVYMHSPNSPESFAMQLWPIYLLRYESFGLIIIPKCLSVVRSTEIAPVISTTILTVFEKSTVHRL